MNLKCRKGPVIVVQKIINLVTAPPVGQYQTLRRIMPTDDPNKEEELDNGGLTITGHKTAPVTTTTREQMIRIEKKQKIIKPKQVTTREQKEDADSNILVMPGKKVPTENNTYTGNVPPPPVDLYHGTQAQVVEIVDGNLLATLRYPIRII